MLIIGLGNPSKEYAGTFHNAGHLAVDFFLPEVRFKTASSKKFAYFKKGNNVFIKSLVFMNDSGIVVKDALKYFKVKPERCAIIHDDSDIALGAFKVAFERGSAGHKGVESVIAHLGTNAFWRVRVGVRERGGKAGGFVLKTMSPKARAIINETFARISLKMKDVFKI